MNHKGRRVEVARDVNETVRQWDRDQGVWDRDRDQCSHRHKRTRCWWNIQSYKQV